MNMRMLPWHFSRIVVLKTETPLLPSWVTLGKNQHSYLISVKVVARTSYHGCRTGGYGLIQWTSANRYYGLGDFAKKYGGSPSSLHTQLRYLTNEVQWKDIESRMKTPGKSINRYMDYAYSWIGWGHHGARTSYAHDYASRLITVEV
jgi:hypothetical protein